MIFDSTRDFGAKLLYIQLHQGELSHPVSALEEYFRSAGVTIVQAAFAHSYFIHSASVKAKTPYFSDRASGAKSLK